MPVRRNIRRNNRRRRPMVKPRRTVVPRGVRLNNTLSCTRLFESTSIVADSAGAYSAGYSFSISNVPDLTDFSNLFDQYRINGIEITLIPNITSNDANPVSTYFEMPNVHSIIDRDDDATPGALTSLMQYPSYRRTRGHMVHKRYWKPSIAQTIYKTGSTTGTSQRGPTWLDLADTTVPHFGLKLYIDQTNTTTDIKYRFYVKLFLQFKGIR